MAIAEFTPEEDDAVRQMQEEMRIGAWGIAPGFRRGLRYGVLRALHAAQGAPPGQHLAAIRALLEE